MTKKYIRFFSFTVAVMMTASLLSGCNSKKNDKASEVTKESTQASTQSSSTEAGTKLPIVDKPLTLKFFVNAPDTRVANGMGDLEVMKEIMKRTNINFEFIHPSAADKGEALNLILASGDYPDLIRSGLSGYKGGIDGAINDGIIYNYTQLVDKHAVNYNKMVKAEKLEKLVKSDTGTQIAFGSTFSCSQFIGKSFSGLVLREDWLKDLGLSVPETVDDWYNVLKAFKEKKDCPAPLGLAEIFSETSAVRAQAFVGSYGAAYTFLLSNDKVKYGPILPEFKSFLETYAKWYKEGLINKDMATHSYSKNIQPMLAEGKVGATTMHPSLIPTIYSMAKGKDPDFKLAPAPFPKVNKGDTVKYRHNHLGVNISPILVTTKCKYPTEAVKFIDYLYSKEAIDLETWGTTEGRTYTLDSKGMHKFTDMVLKNPDGLTVALARNKYTLDTLQSIWNWEWEQQQYTLPEQLNSTWGLWSSSATADNYIPELITMTAEENSTYTTVVTQVNAYAQEMILKFIMGLEPISNFDKFVSQCKAMGIEKAEQARQTAYERFKKR